MRKSGIWSLMTLIMLISVLLAGGLATPAVARPAEDDATPAELEGIEENNGTSRKQALLDAAGDEFISYAQPDEVLLHRLARAKLGSNASQQQVEAKASQLLTEWQQNSYHGPRPQDYRKLLQNEQRALATDSSPAAMGLALTGTLRLFTVAIEFAGTDTADNFSHPVSVDDRTCVTETLTFEGPLHNTIAPPGPRDNYSLWRPSFEREYYEKLLYSTEGITERVRPDLIDPEDGQPGIDISGMTMQNYYNEQSGGKVTVEGGPDGVIAWLQVPHSEAYYAANACFVNEETGEYDAGRIQTMDGLPQNPSFEEYGTGRFEIIKDVIAAINASDPDFPWQEYDIDGKPGIDHVIFIHAGENRARGGPFTSFWAHKSGVPNDPDFIADDGGTPDDPADDVIFTNYTMQYEALDLGVLVHEFGHDLGYPDLYDTSGLGESNVVWWDLMSTGSNNGKIGGFPPSGLSAWSKFALGWTDPLVVEPGATPQDVVLGQSALPPPGTTQAVLVPLPNTTVTYTELPAGSTQTYWTNKDQNNADNTLTHAFDLTGQTGALSMSFDIDWNIEEDWDYLFVEVSVDGGQTFTQTKGFEVGTDDLLTTGDNDSDPNGGLAANNKQFGYTGSSGGFVRAYHDLTPFVGQNVLARFTYRTDEAVVERGAFIDNIVVSSDGGVLFNDPVENNDLHGWVPNIASRVPGGDLGTGWVFSNGTEEFAKYYLLEWRNAEGYDKALKYTYNTIFAEETPEGGRDFRVDLIPTNVPGMMVWVRDTRYGGDPFDADNSILNGDRFTAFPSEGPKGGLLAVDANFEPLRGPRGATFATEYGTYAYPPLNSWRGRVQTNDSAFTLHSNPAITVSLSSDSADPATTVVTPTVYPERAGVAGFHDALGYFAGVEELPEPIKVFEGEAAPGVFVQRLKKYAFSDPDGGVVTPAKEYYSPRTPAGFTGRGGETSPPSVNVSTFETIYTSGEPTSGYPVGVDLSNYNTVNVGEAGGTNVTGQQSGNPGSTEVQYGYHFVVTDQANDGSTGTVRIYNAPADAQAQGDIGPIVATAPVTITASVQNTGSPHAVVLYSDFDERQATYVDGSATNGAIPVTADRPLAEELARTQGLAGLQSVRAQSASEVRAVVWYSPGALDSGEQASFTYQVTPKAGVFALRVNTFVVGQGIFNQDVVQNGTFVYLPQIENTQPATTSVR